MTGYFKTEPEIFLASFIKKASEVQSFRSSRGKRYEVIAYDGQKLFFCRADAKADILWELDLLAVYKAYKQLSSFESVALKPFVDRRQSPARGLLLHLGLLERV